MKHIRFTVTTILSKLLDGEWSWALMELYSMVLDRDLFILAMNDS